MGPSDYAKADLDSAAAARRMAQSLRFGGRRRANILSIATPGTITEPLAKTWVAPQG